jgi:hypothetical protein
MYTVYIVFAVILALSFVTGNFVLLVEHKRNVKKSKERIVFDEEII